MKISKSRKRKLLRLIVLFGFFIFGLIIVGLLYLLFFSSFLKIKSVNVTSELYDLEVKNIIESKANEFWFGTIPKDTRIAFPKNSTRNLVLQKFPEIKSLTISSRGLHNLFATYTLKTPTFRLEDGRVLDESGAPFKDRRDTSALPDINGDRTSLSVDGFASLVDLVQRINVRLFPIVEIDLGEAGDVTLKDKDNKEVRISLRKNKDEEWSRLLSALDTSPLKDAIDRGNDFYFIDLRFANKVFYSLHKGTSSGSVSTTTATTTSN